MRVILFNRVNMEQTPIVTYSTCWYNFKKKFDNQIYFKWIDNMLSNVNQYNLVIYSDKESSEPLEKYTKNNPRIVLIIKPFETFYNYKYADKWINNHRNNYLLNSKVDWKVNMLWAEKTHFVNETMKQKYFDTEYYGWCDIGYFRGGNRDLSAEELKNWSNPAKIRTLKKEKVYYALVNNDDSKMYDLRCIIQKKNILGLPQEPIPPFQVSIAGGFFVSHKTNIEWWKNTFDEKLATYFLHDYLVKDDQIIVVDCIFSNQDRFCLCKENNILYDNWFLFQRFLM